MKTAQDLLRKEFIKVDVSDTVLHLLSELRRTGDHSACIFDGGVFKGVFNYRSILKSRINTSTTVASLVTSVSKISPDTDLVDVAALMFTANAVMLPVFEHSKLIGVVTVFDILKNMGEVAEIKNLRVKDIRHPLAIFIDEKQSVNKALEIMFNEHIDRLPVVEGMKVVGFLSITDLLDKFYRWPVEKQFKGEPKTSKPQGSEIEKNSILELPVSQFMHEGALITVKESELVSGAATLLVENNVLSVLVPDDGLYSIVTKRDILEAIMHTRVEENRNIQYIGLSDLHLSTFDIAWVQKICSYYAEKLQREIQNEFRLAVHFKIYSKEGKRHKYSIHIRVTYPGRTVRSDHAHDWDIRRAVHKAFRDVEHQFRHKAQQKEQKGSTSATEFYS